LIREIELGGVRLQYDLQYKNVKNINLRIKPDKTIHVSAGRRVPVSAVESFMKEKSSFIVGALERLSHQEEKAKHQYRTSEELMSLVERLCRSAYPHYRRYGIIYPQIRFRNAVSRWGSCNPAKNVLMFNLNLVYAPEECVRYVVWHEFTHFLQPNHSPKFYEELEKVFPDWKSCRQKLRQIHIR